MTAEESKCTDMKGNLSASVCVFLLNQCACLHGCKAEGCLAVSPGKNDFLPDKKGGRGFAVVWRREDVKLSPSDCDCQAQGQAIISLNLC